MNEQGLHEQLKEWYADKTNAMEVNVDNYIIDVLKDGLLIEIQTSNFSTIKSKLNNLLNKHKVRLVYPIPYRKWIIRLNRNGEKVGSRKSPKKGRIEEMFFELVYIPNLCCHKNFELEIVLVDVNEYWIDDGKGSWRRKHWSIYDRKLLRVHKTYLFQEPSDFLSIIPSNLSKQFTVKEFTKMTGLTQSLSSKMIYSLRKMGLIKTSGKKGKANLYSFF